MSWFHWAKAMAQHLDQYLEINLRDRRRDRAARVLDSQMPLTWIRSATALRRPGCHDSHDRHDQVSRPSRQMPSCSRFHVLGTSPIFHVQTSCFHHACKQDSHGYWHCRIDGPRSSICMPGLGCWIHAPLLPSTDASPLHAACILFHG